MTATYQNLGGLGSGSTSATPVSLPTGIATGDLALLMVITKPDTATVATPSGWTLVANVAGGGGTTGNQVGPTRQAWYSRVKDGSWATTPTVSITNGNASASVVARVSPTAGGTFDITAATGTFGDAGVVTNAASTLGSDPGITTDDLLLVGYSNMDDAANWSAQGVTAPGATIGAATERSDIIETTTGNDVGGMIYTASATAGASTGAPSTQATASTATRGTVVLVRVREVSGSTPSTGTASGSFSFTGSATGTRAPKGTASGSFTFAGTAAGKRAPKATAAGTFTFTGTAVGKRTPKASGSGSFTLTGTAVGSRPAKGAAGGSYTYSGTATGARTPKATASGTYTYAGTATGTAPVVGGAEGTAIGSYHYTGTAEGVTQPKGTAEGAYAYAGEAVGHSPVVGAAEGFALGSYTYTGTAIGAAPGLVEPPTPQRRIVSAVLTIPTLAADLEVPGSIAATITARAVRADLTIPEARGVLT